MKRLITTLLLSSSSLFLFAQSSITVPVGGNSWVTPLEKRNSISENGWTQWISVDEVYTTYFALQKTGRIQIKAILPTEQEEAVVECTFNGKRKTIRLKANQEIQVLGEWTVYKPGYQTVTIKGISKKGNQFPAIKALEVNGTAVTTEAVYVKDNNDGYFYWGRRGPSVHLSYDTKHVEENTEWYYSEITVPEGNDVIGSYYMANGFKEGYFGIQVNSPTERRVLFSVWSPFHTDDPKSIPEDQKIILVKKGKDVYTGEFGNEGSGGQSYLQYNWKAGSTYRFLLQGKPVEKGYTNYTAYFYSPEEMKWQLIASFNRPKTTTYLKGFHSFLENFDPTTSTQTRKAYFHNQWVATTDKKWHKVNRATFTIDATARKRFRSDYKGGSETDKFFLQNCGFFNDSTAFRTPLEIKTTSQAPLIPWSELEK